MPVSSRKNRWTWPVVLALLVASAGVVPTPHARAQIVRIPRLEPNLIFVMTDDQRADQISVMPNTIRNFPVEFSQATVSTPLCCPSRATYLTGEYAHNHDVWTNFDYHEEFQPREADSLGPWLQAQGYYTGFVGRYLNKYSITDPTPPGWDEFYARVGEADTGNLWFNGYTKMNAHEHYRVGTGNVTRIARYPNRDRPSFYSTDYYADMATRFIDRAENLSYNLFHKPWALVIWPTAPHLPLIPALRHRTAPVPPWSPPPSFLEPNMGDKPAEVRARTYQNLSEWGHRRAHDGMLRMLMSVDELVDRVWDTVDEHGLRPSTWGLFASDNGWFLGEHRKMEKVYAYEEAARVPFRMAMPGARPMVIDELVSNVDVAPTFMDLAGDSSTHHFRGRSLLPLIEDDASGWRTAALIEARSAIVYDAVRTERWKFIRWSSGALELYDLLADPYELTNIAARNPDVVAELQRTLDSLKRL
jgi:arylsulfatase A-like enzyme